MKPQRLNYIDRIKGFAILLVVLGHVYLFVLNSHDSYIDKFIGSQNMNMFMFISGYVSYSSVLTDNFKTAVKKISIRCVSYFVPMYIVGWLLAWFCLEVLPNDNGMRSHIFYSAPYGSWYWYLKVLGIVSIITLPMQIFQSKILDVFLPFITLIGFFFLWKSYPSLTPVFCSEHIVCFFPFFTMGFLAKKYPLIYKITDSDIVCTISLIMYVYCFFSNFDNHLLNNLSDRLVQPMTAIIVIVYFFKKSESIQNNLMLNTIQRLGKSSLFVYLFHYFFIVHINLPSIWNGYSNDNSFLILLAMITFTFIISYLSLIMGEILSKNRLMELIILGKINKGVKKS